MEATRGVWLDRATAMAQCAGWNSGDGMSRAWYHFKTLLKSTVSWEDQMEEVFERKRAK